MSENPDVISPLARVHLNRVAALVVGSIDQDAIGAGLPHFSESDFIPASARGHMPMIPRIGHQGKSLQLGLPQRRRKARGTAVPQRPALVRAARSE